MKQKLIERLAAELRARKANIERMEIRLQLLFPGDPVSGGAAMFGYINGVLDHTAQLYGNEYGLGEVEISQAVQTATTQHAQQFALEAIRRIMSNNY
jgi:hypothetical protein